MSDDELHFWMMYLFNALQLIALCGIVDLLRDIKRILKDKK